MLLKRKLLELKDIHLGVLDCSCSDDENILDGNINLLHEYKDLFIDMDVRNNRSELAIANRHQER